MNDYLPTSEGQPDPNGRPNPKRAPEPSWLDQLRDRLAEWIDTLVNPPMPVPVPVRRRR